MTDHLRPCAEIAPEALLPGDPGRAMALAQELTDSPRMANHARGLWGYTGTTPAGRALTVQSTGVGGPSVAVVLEELASLGVARAIRIGTCRALDPALQPGDALVVGAAIGDDGTSSALGGAATGEPDAVLTAELARVAGLDPVVVASADLYYDPEAGPRRERWRQAGASAADLGTAAAFATGARLGVAVACGLVVATDAGGEGLDDDAVQAASLKLGRSAAEALAAGPEARAAQPPGSGTPTPP